MADRYFTLPDARSSLCFHCLSTSILGLLYPFFCLFMILVCWEYLWCQNFMDGNLPKKQNILSKYAPYKSIFLFQMLLMFSSLQLDAGHIFSFLFVHSDSCMATLIFEVIEWICRRRTTINRQTCTWLLFRSELYLAVSVFLIMYTW